MGVLALFRQTCKLKCLMLLGTNFSLTANVPVRKVRKNRMENLTAKQIYDV
jgi:hypothetical protein